VALGFRPHLQMEMPRHVMAALKITGLPWLVYLLDIVLPIDLRIYGIQPRHVEGIQGILFAPFLHSGLPHLAANSGALLILLFISLYYNRGLTYRSLLIIIVGGGSLVWVFGRSHSLHIGASGVVFGLIGFLVFLGIYRREWKALLVSLTVAFFYGGTLLSLLTRTPGISWEGHFFGFVMGIAAASRGKRT